MRPLSFALPVTLLLLAPTAGAQSGSYPATGDPSASGDTMSTVQVSAQPPAFRLWDYQAEDVSGAYRLSNGWRLNVEPARDGVMARIDKQRPIRLVALSPDKFVSRDGNVIVEFNQGNAHDDMTMSYIPASSTNPQLAQVIVATAKMALR